MDELLRAADERGTTSNEQYENHIDDEAEYVPLPSEGRYYKGQYKGMDKLKVRKLNWTDEDILTTKSYYDNGTLFDELLKKTIVDSNGFQAEDLVPIDRDTIIWWLRIGAFGVDYTLPIPCTNPGCKNKISTTWNLADFDMPELPDEYKQEVYDTGGLVITLPASKLKCKITVATVGKEIKVNKFLKKRKENLAKNPKMITTNDFIMTGRLLASIEIGYGVNGEENKGIDGVLSWLNTGYNGKPLPILDSRYIVKKLSEITLKVDTRKDVVCGKCEHTQEGVAMPMTIYFLWPEYDQL